MSIYAKLGGYVGLQPDTTAVYHDRTKGAGWEALTVTKRGQWFDVDFVEAKKPLRLNEQTKQLETGDHHDGWGGQWIVEYVNEHWQARCDTVMLALEGYKTAPGPGGPIHLEQRGNDFVDAQGQRIVFPAIDGFDDLWFRTTGRESELDALMRESVQIGMRVRRIWCMGDAGENQVFSLYPQNTPAYFDWLRSIVTYENSYGIIPLFTAFVDAQRVMPNQGDRKRFWSQANEALYGIGSYLWSGGNQRSKNGFDPWQDLVDPGHGVIWSRGSDVDDTEVGPRGAPASELHATRNSFDRALMDATASPPTMRGPASTKDGHPVGGSGMVWMTEGNPFGDGGGYSETQARQLGCGYSILWALAVHHNRQSQRGQLMHDDTARTAAAWSQGMTKGMFV